MGGMTKKRKYGSPGSKSIVNEEEVGESGHVEGEKRNTDETVRQGKDRDTTDSTGGATGGFSRRAGAGVRQRSSTVDQRCDRYGHTGKYKERSEHVTMSGRMYKKVERNREREEITLSDRVRQGSEDILRRMDRHDTSNEDLKRIVREGLTALSDTVETEMTGICEKMTELVRKVVQVEVTELKDRVERLEGRGRTREDTVSERMRKVEERTEKSVEKETMMSHKMERAEDRIKETEEVLKKMEQKRINERLENVEEILKDSEEEKRQDNRTNRLETLEEKIVD